NTDDNTPVKDTILNTDDNTPVKDSQYKCNYKPSIKRENIFIFSFPFKEKVSEGIKECFKESKEKCGCGGVITTRRSIINPALNMLLHVDRVILTDKGVIKVNDGLSVDKYDIGCYYKDISEFGVSNVKDIISTNNDERYPCLNEGEEEKGILKSVGKTNYLWKSSVCHFGEKTLSGHYVWVVGDEEIVVVNDSSVNKGDEDVVGQYFLLCYSV
ncbi:hypothetical protein CWI39_0281p0020, partial [Hamiltosporidium magnivora]